MHSKEDNRYKNSCAYKSLIAIARMAADLIAVAPFLCLGIGALYVEDLYGVKSTLLTTITSIGTGAMMICSFVIVHASCNKCLQVEDEDVSIPTFIPYTP